MPSSTSKLLTRKKKAAQQFRRGSKTFRHKKNLKQKISVKKLYTKDKRKGKRFTRVARGFVDDLKAAVIHANKLEETCVFCQMPIEEISNATELVCGHIFHTDCLIKALSKGFIKCPLCKAQIFSNYFGTYITNLLSYSPHEALNNAEAVLDRANERAPNTNAEYMADMAVRAMRVRVEDQAEAATADEEVEEGSEEGWGEEGWGEEEEF